MKEAERNEKRRRKYCQLIRILSKGQSSLSEGHLFTHTHTPLGPSYIFKVLFSLFPEPPEVQRFLGVGHDPGHGLKRHPAKAQRSHQQSQHPETEKHQDIHGPSPSCLLYHVTVHLKGVECTGTPSGRTPDHVEDMPMLGEGKGIDEEESDQGDHHEVL